MLFHFVNSIACSLSSMHGPIFTDDVIFIYWLEVAVMSTHA